jgi:hypothetical protein
MNTQTGPLWNRLSRFHKGFKHFLFYQIPPQYATAADSHRLTIKSFSFAAMSRRFKELLCNQVTFQIQSKCTLI